MKKSKWLALAGVTLSAGFILAACSGSQSSNAKTTYSYVFQADPDSLDYIMSNRATTSQITTNFIDGLLENDRYGNLVPSIAEDWSVSQDGLTYTYKLRDNAKWYTSDGEEYANVTAHDFVTGLKYAADNKSDALYLVQNSVKGLDDYVTGKTKDFSTVGVKAVDDYTLEYTLNQPESFWNSKTTTTILAPVNQEFLQSAGSDFGAVRPSGLLYNGPYILKAFTSKSAIEMVKNENYWDKDNVKIEDVKLSYYDGSDTDALGQGFLDGAYTIGRLFPTSSTYQKMTAGNEENVIFSNQLAATYYYTFNVNRQSYNHTAKKNDTEKSDSRKAMMNKDFRQAINFAFDRHPYMAQANGEDGADRALRNTLVPTDFVQIGDKDFGVAVNEKIVNYGTEWANVDLSDTKNAFASADKAKEEFAKAKAALEADGVKFPIHLDVPVDQSNKIFIQQANSFKQTVENNLGTDNVIIDVVQMSTEDKDNANYFAESASQKDYDLDITGWGPDYQDPSSYLDILGTSDGAILDSFGIDPSKDASVIEQLGLKDYQSLLDNANAEKNDLETRYDRYAEAQAWLTDSSLILPVRADGANPAFRKTVPFTEPFSFVGSKGDIYNYKYTEIQDAPVTQKQYQEAREKWLKEKAESNKKAQEDLASHVK